MIHELPKIYAGKPRLLIVDDEEINRELLSSMLEESFDIEMAGDGLEALQILRESEHPFALILLDLHMPRMDGFEFMNQKKAIPSIAEIPVIVLTSETKMEVDCLRIGAVDFIKKPYESPEIVRARVDRIVALYESSLTIRQTSADRLTGLFTKEYFDLYVSAKEQLGLDLDMVALHLDHFSTIHEAVGKEQAEEIQRRIGAFLLEESDKHEAVATHPSEDTFFYCGPHREDYEDFLAELNDRLMALPFANNVHLYVGVYPEFGDNSDVEMLRGRAKDALMNIPEDSPTHIGYYDETLHKKALFQERLLGEFDHAIADRQFCVFFQPKYDISCDKPVLAGAEALVRWKHPELGMVSPGVFIPMFEDNGLIGTLDAYVYEETARVLGRLEKELGKSLPISANVSRAEVFNPDTERHITDSLRKHNVPRKYLHLEITESAFTTRNHELSTILGVLREKGFAIEMDDFGTGYSSLNMLSELPLDILKIDMGFARNMHKSERNKLIVKTIVDIAHILNLRVIAEGVETKEQCDTLKSFGCDLIQGYYFSKPLPEEEFIQLVRKEFDL